MLHIQGGDGKGYCNNGFKTATAQTRDAGVFAAVPVNETSYPEPIMPIAAVCHAFGIHSLLCHVLHTQGPAKEHVLDRLFRLPMKCTREP